MPGESTNTQEVLFILVGDTLDETSEEAADLSGRADVEAGLNTCLSGVCLVTWRPERRVG